MAETPRVQVPNNHILSKILTHITTILGPLDPWGKEHNSTAEQFEKGFGLLESIAVARDAMEWGILSACIVPQVMVSMPI